MATSTCVHSARRFDGGFSLLEVLIVVGVSTILAAIAVPMMGNALGSFRLSGDARNLTNAVSLAKLRAASDFTKARLFVDLSVNGFHVEVWQKGSPGSWTTEGGVTYLSSASETFGFGAVSSPPPATQAAIQQAPQCLSATGTAIASSACVVFNSRGVPVTDAAGTTGGPYNGDVLYQTDGTAVYAVTASVTSMIQLWRTNPVSTPSWGLQ